MRRVITKNISFQIAVFPVGHDKVLGLEKGLYIKNVSILNAYFQIQALVSYPPPPPHPSKVELLVSSCLDTLLMGYTDYHCHYCKLWGFMFAFKKKHVELQGDKYLRFSPGPVDYLGT